MARVFVTQVTQHDLAPATKHGEMVVLVEHARDASFPQSILRTMRRKLKDFTDQDFLLLVGDPVAMALAVNAAANANRGRVKILKWSRDYGDYYPMQIDFNQGDDDES